MLFPTSLAGSYPQPDWLSDREKLAGCIPPRVRDLWRVAPEYLDQAQDNATLIAIRDQERAGLDIITGREMRAMAAGAALVRAELGSAALVQAELV